MTMHTQEFSSRVSPKGQITVAPRESRLLRHYQIAGALEKPLIWREIEEIAHEEHAERVRT
ncbi:MAG: hypothetical protein ACRDIY_04770 [Chloroflexota bacterium]